MLWWRQTAISTVVWLVLAQQHGAQSAPTWTHACLGRKDAKQVEKARDQEKRLLAYVGIARGGASGLWYCLTFLRWDERTNIKGCPGIDDKLGVIDCATQGIAEELAAWKLLGAKPDAALHKAECELQQSESLLKRAEDDARRLGLGPVVPNQIKASRRSLEDQELMITKLLAGRPTPSSGCSWKMKNSR